MTNKILSILTTLILGISTCISSFAASSCNVSEINQITTTKACQNFVMNCGFSAVEKGADAGFASFFPDFMSSDNTQTTCDTQNHLCKVTEDAGCSYLASSSSSTLWQHAKTQLLTPVVKALNTAPHSPAPYTKAVLTCTYTCKNIKNGTCTDATPPISQWHCQPA